MCFGNSSPQYDAVKSGDYDRWLATFNDPQARLNGYDKELRKKIAADPNADMKAREAERQFGVSTGKSNIDSAFGQFNDGYYDKFKGDYKGYYFPQIDDQYKEATGKLTAALAGRGVLNSSVGSGAIGKLSAENDKVRTNIGNEAQDAANKLRGNVEGAKTNLYNLNESSADPASINARAVGEATALVAPPTYNPIGQVFANFLQPWLAARQNQNNASLYSPYKSPFGAGSGMVVN